MKLDELFAAILRLLSLRRMKVSLAIIYFVFGASIFAKDHPAKSKENYCLSLTAKDQSYKRAKNTIFSLSKVVIQQRQLAEVKRNFVINSRQDKTIFRDEICYWEISLYENAGDHLVLWNTYQSSIIGNIVYEINLADPDDLIIVK